MTRNFKYYFLIELKLEITDMYYQYTPTIRWIFNNLTFVLQVMTRVLNG